MFNQKVFNLLYACLLIAGLGRADEIPTQLLAEAEQQVTQVRNDLFGQSSIVYRFSTLGETSPMEVFDIDNHKIELRDKLATGVGRYVYYPVKDGALILDGSSFVSVDRNGRATQLTPQLNVKLSELTYNFKNGVIVPVQPIVYLDGSSDGGDPLGFRTGNHLRSDVLTHSRFVSNQAAKDQIPVMEIFFDFSEKAKVYQPKVLLGHDLTGVTHISINANRCTLKPVATSLLSRSLNCPRVLTSQVNNTVEFLKGNKLAATIPLGNQCGPEFKIKKPMFFGIHAGSSEASNGDPDGGSLSIRKRCENFGGCLTETFKVVTADFDNTQDGINETHTVSQMACNIKEIDLNRISKPLKRVVANPDTTGSIIDFISSRANPFFHNMDGNPICLSDLDCHLRPKLLKIFGTIFGLKGALSLSLTPLSRGLRLRFTQPASAKTSGSFSFPKLMPEGSTFKLSIKAPKNQSCTVADPDRVTVNKEGNSVVVTCVDK